MDCVRKQKLDTKVNSMLPNEYSQDSTFRLYNGETSRLINPFPNDKF